MIVFYHKDTKKVIGTINGRVHGVEEMKMTIGYSNVPKSKVKKYVIPFKTVYKLVEEPVFENRVVDRKILRVEQVLVGKKKVKRGTGMKPDVPFAKLILDFESGKKKIYDYCLELKDGKVVGFKKQ